MKLMAAVMICLGPLLLAATAETPAEIGIRKAQEEIGKLPDHAAGYNSLALAYARRARETADGSYLQKAQEALQRSFKIAPGNFEGRKAAACVLIGQHEFRKALELATALNKETPDDIAVYGYLADADSGLGNYPEALEAAQWMLNMRAGNVPALTRAAGLREVHGKLSGALELMQMAYDSTPFEQREDRAWELTEMSRVALAGGDPHKAETYATGALGLFSKYHYALGALARVRMAQGRDDDAVNLLQQRYESAPRPANLYDLARAQELAGRQDEAAKSFAEFERKAVSESTSADNANRELIDYYIDGGHKPAEALRIAESEAGRRQDVFTLDSLAWALAANGDDSRANAEEQRALAIGTKDATILYHAGSIALRRGDAAEAHKFLDEAAAGYSREARALLQNGLLPARAAN